MHFIIFSSEGVVLVNAVEISFGGWELVHVAEGGEDVFVGAGEEPCAVLMIGSRREDEAHYPVNEVAAKYGASATSATDSPAEAYAEWRTVPRERVPNPWPLG